MGKTITVNMKQFKERFRVYSDNLKIFEMIELNKGSFFTFTPDIYMDALNEFNIFYTVK